MIALYILAGIVALLVYLFLGKIGIRIIALQAAILNKLMGESFDYGKYLRRSNDATPKILWPVFIVALLFTIIVTVATRFIWIILKFIYLSFKWAWSTNFRRK